MGSFHCYQAFLNDSNNVNHSLHLGFYLASWGMYRGSCGLLQKNHLVHTEAVKLIFSTDYKSIHCKEGNDLSEKDIKVILNLKRQLSQYYSGIQFVKGSTVKNITATDTLISKVMLGSLACVPAYDRFFISGLSEAGKEELSKFNEKSLSGLLNYRTKDVNDAQKIVKQELDLYYPKMKILDIYFWQLGYNKSITEEMSSVKKN